MSGSTRQISFYLVAVGSNRAGPHGGPREQVAAALARLGGTASRIVESRPIGPSHRRFANAATLIASTEHPPALLARLKQLECAFGRRPGRRWGARALDLDIVLWSGGRWRRRLLTVPHAAFRERAFVLEPALGIAAGWRDPDTGATIRQLHARLTRRRPINRRADGSGP